MRHILSCIVNVAQQLFLPYKDDDDDESGNNNSHNSANTHCTLIMDNPILILISI